MMMWIAFGCFSTVIVYVAIVLLLFETTTEYNYNQGPGLTLLIIKAVYRIITRRQGKLYLKCEDSKNQEERNRFPADKSERVVFKNCRIDEAKLTEYNKICGKVVVVPFCYLESLFLPSLVILATGSSFKLSPLGLIHIRQTIQVHSPLENLIKEPFELESKVKEYRVVERGIEVDVALSVINQTGFGIWEGEVTLLSRCPVSPQSGRIQSRKISLSSLDNGAISSVIRVEGTTGIKYARATGDWNPHHLYTWTAQLLGYRLPIAHGMWVLAKMISLIQTEESLENYPICINAVFKRPLFMPGEAIFKYSRTLNNRHDFSVIEKETAVPHLVGSIIS